MSAFSYGPFSFDPSNAMRVAGTPSRRWTMMYGQTFIAESIVPDPAQRAAVIAAFDEHRRAFIREAQPQEPTRERSERYEVALMRSTENTGEAGECLSSFLTSLPVHGMTPGMIDNRHETWAIDAHGGSQPMALDEFKRLADAHIAADRARTACEQLQNQLDRMPVPPNAWITGLLPAAVLATDPNDWRAPSSWEIRHVVGEGSFTGLSGAKAATLVGITPQNFRKYTASGGAKHRQNMSFAAWHLLLHKLGVQYA